MKKYAVLVVFLIMAMGVYSDSQLACSIVINSNPQAKPNDTAIIYGIITNEGSLVSNFSLSVIRPSEVAVSITPTEIMNVAPNQQFIVKLVLLAEASGTYNITLVVNQTYKETEGNVTLSNLLMTNIVFFVDPNVETTKENPPVIQVSPTTTEETTTGMTYWGIALAIFIVITVIVVFIPLMKYWEHIKKKI